MPNKIADHKTKCAFVIDRKTLAAFRDACAAIGSNMTAELAKFMERFAKGSP